MSVITLLLLALWAHPFTPATADQEEEIRCTASEIEAHTLQLKDALLAAVHADSLLTEVRGQAVEDDFYEDGAFSCNTPIPNCAECTIGEFGSHWQFGLSVAYEGDRTAFVAFVKLYKAIATSLRDLGYEKDEEKSSRERVILKKVIRKATMKNEMQGGELRLKYLDVVDKVSIKHSSFEDFSRLTIFVKRDVVNLF